jgi:hypothetical protein
MEELVHLVNAVISHPYSLAVYGVLLWQVEQWFESKENWRTFLGHSQRNIGRSLIWVGVVVVFDDEIMAKYNHWAAVDYAVIPLWFYTAAGFFIDLIRSKFIDRVK